MPGQQRLRAHRERSPSVAGKHSAERRQKDPIVCLEARLLDPAAKNRQLVVQHEDLKLLRSIPTPEEHDELDQAADAEVQDTSKGDFQQTETPTLPTPQQPARLTRSGICTPRVRRVYKRCLWRPPRANLASTKPGMAQELRPTKPERAPSRTKTTRSR